MKKIAVIESGLAKIDRDLQFLIESFASVLERMDEKNLADALPWRTSSKKIIASAALPERLGQAYSIAFQLLNLVEENASAQSRRQRETTSGLQTEPGLWGDQFEALKKLGLHPAEIARALQQIRVEAVLTAHPTEAKRSTVLEQHRALYHDLIQRENQMWTVHEQEIIQRDIEVSLERLWRTGEILLIKPDVAAERSAAMYYLREAFPGVLAHLDQRLKLAWDKAGFDAKLMEDPASLPKLRFGCWVGGDRDGHPLVTDAVTKESLLDLRLNALIVLQRQLTTLTEQLCLSKSHQKVPTALITRINRLATEADAWGELILKKHAQEPWRQFSALMTVKLPVDLVQGSELKISDQPGRYLHPREVMKDLQLLRASLLEVGAGQIAHRDVDPIIRSLDVFGFHLAALDIRQNSRFHELALSQLMKAAGLDGDAYLKADEAGRLAILNAELASPRPFTPTHIQAGPEAEAVLSCYKVIGQHLHRYGPEALGALIVSMTRTVSDLLAVYLLAREAGLARFGPDGLVCLLPVVPLFETIDDLQRSPVLLEAFLLHPVTQRSLRALQNHSGYALLQPAKGVLGPIIDPPVEPLTQQVMIGYSDSNKDSGILASQWSLHRAQTELTGVSRRTGVHLRFFHGRGGTISRGAGPTHRFLQALPHGSIEGDLRVTEQGETIAQKYANLGTATYNLELLLAGTTGVTLRHIHTRHTPHTLEPVLDQLCEWSRVAYQALLGTPDFMAFYGEATPIDALEISGIGSRPSRRTGMRTLADLRAIPWVFSWTQSRFYLPGWFGVGTALETLRKENPTAFHSLSKHTKTWPFLGYVLTNVETNLASANAEVMREYANLVTDDKIRRRFSDLISAEFQRTENVFEEIFKGKFLQRRPRMAKTLVLREGPLRILHQQQVKLLKQWRTLKAENDPDAAERLRPQLLLSINAIASGLRTTG